MTFHFQAKPKQKKIEMKNDLEYFSALSRAQLCKTSETFQTPRKIFKYAYKKPKQFFSHSHRTLFGDLIFDGCTQPTLQRSKSVGIYTQNAPFQRISFRIYLISLLITKIILL